MTTAIVGDDGERGACGRGGAGRLGPGVAGGGADGELQRRAAARARRQLLGAGMPARLEQLRAPGTYAPCTLLFLCIKHTGCAHSHIQVVIGFQ